MSGNDGPRLSEIPDELVCRMTAFLDVSSLLTMRFVNKRMGQIATTDEAGWSNHCKWLWKDKVHVSQDAKAHAHAMEAYRISRHDAKTRNYITLKELCYDIERQEGTIWAFRFKRNAGIDWTATDPWWMGRQARQMVLLLDGTVKRFISASSQDEALVQQEVMTTDQSTASIYHVQGGILVDPFGPMTWRFLTHPMDMSSGPVGSYLRFRVAGRDVPTYVVRRSPTGNWGFIMESCWGVYASFDLPIRRVLTGGARYLPVDDSDAETERNNVSSSSSLLMNDSAFIITNQIQMREAILYNSGA